MFESELKNTYDIESCNGMIFIDVSKVKKLAECNLINFILNSSKHTKTTNNHYYPIR